MDVRALSIALLLGCGTPTASVEAADPQPAAEAAPQDNAWITRHAKEGTTPEGATRLWLEAAIAYSDPARREAAADALQYLTIPLKDDDQWESRPSNATFVERLTSQPHLFRSYAVGATPDNAYAAPAGWTLNVDRVEPKRDDRGTRVFLVSGGADSPRPVYVKQSTKSGLWYLNQWANTYVGIRPIVDPDAETFE